MRRAVVEALLLHELLVAVAARPARELAEAVVVVLGDHVVLRLEGRRLEALAHLLVPLLVLAQRHEALVDDADVDVLAAARAGLDLSLIHI